MHEMEHRQESHDPEVLVLDINLTRGTLVVLMIAFLVAAFAGALALGRGDVVANSVAAVSQQTSLGSRRYYMAPSFANQAVTACASGYHMASLWEIMDTSNLEYDLTLGEVRGDSGQGPPSGHAGWVRTGYDTSTADVVGQANCDGWTSNDTNHYGTAVGRPYNWLTDGDIADWAAVTVPCDSGGMLVWCVED